MVFNAVPARGPLAGEAMRAVRGLGGAVVPAMAGQRVVHVHAFTAGRTAQELEPWGRAAAEVEALYRWTTREALA